MQYFHLKVLKGSLIRGSSRNVNIFLITEFVCKGGTFIFKHLHRHDNDRYIVSILKLDLTSNNLIKLYRTSFCVVTLNGLLAVFKPPIIKNIDRH